MVYFQPPETDQGIMLQRNTLLVSLWFIVGFMTRATHARHNITAALVALAPVLDTDTEIVLKVDNNDGSAGSILTVNWILLSTAVVVQFLLLLQRWFGGDNDKTQKD